MIISDSCKIQSMAMPGELAIQLDPILGPFCLYFKAAHVDFDLAHLEIIGKCHSLVPVK